MDAVGFCAATSAGDNKRRVNNNSKKKNRYWQKRLHLRKTAVRPPAMQSEDKHGPKKKTAAAVVEEWEQSVAWPSSKKKPSQETRQSQRRRNDGGGGNTLRFTCSQCKDNSAYVPKDLARHFEEKHRGSPPVFSCHMCTFSAHEFSYLQVHLLSHKDTFSSCSICDDKVQRTWAEFSAHLTMSHCPNGKYSCEMCQKFSTGDVKVFLEHMFVHNLDLEGADGADPSLHAKAKDQTLRCPHCSYEASQKWLITKHIKAVHVCQNGNGRRKKKEVHSIATKPNDTIPKMKPRLTRSAVREMCWLTQDCLSLPGREFLDKYCHLSDPQTTLQETQQFLMKSVAGETGDQKWTKALKTVLSNVPQDMNFHPKSENGLVSNSSDLTVLTVKNKITVAQNGATYAKRLKMMTPSDVSPESAASDAQCAVDQNGCQSNLNDHTPCPQTENKLHNDVSASVQNEASECTQMQENRENQELKADEEMEEHGKKLEGTVHGDGIHASGELKLTNESEEPTSIHKTIPKNKRQYRRQKRKNRFRKVDRRTPEPALKIVLKKNPVKEKQWVSQSSLSPSGGGEVDAHHGPPDPHTASEKIVQKKWTKGSQDDPSGGVDSALQSKPAEELCDAKAGGSKNDALEGSPPTQEVEKTPQLTGTEVDASASGVETCPENLQLQTSQNGTDCHVSEDKKSSHSSSGSTRSSPVSQPAITPEGEINVEDYGLSEEQSVEGVRDKDEPADLLSSIHFSPEKAIQQEPSPASRHRWQPAPKHLERTLKLVAINPSQLVKRPAGDQPVVVLNHPDADIPEVARIMEVVNRYRGEVQRVVLSRRTLNALSVLSGEAPEADDPTTEAEPARHGKNSVQERFTLKLRLRRLSRKKYEIVGAVSPDGGGGGGGCSRDAVTKFSCWFCGRVFTNQDVCTAHWQRHLMEWKKRNCKNS